MSRITKDRRSCRADLAPLGGFVILIVVLMIRPQGLFSFGRQRQV